MTIGSGESADVRRIDAAVIDLAIRLAFLGLLAYFSFSLVSPFIAIVLWAVILAVAVYPVHSWATRILGGRSKLASFAITMIGLAITTGPLALLATSLLQSLEFLADGLKTGSLPLPAPNEAVKDWPLIGKGLYKNWALATTNFSAFIKQNSDLLKSGGSAVLGLAASLGGSVLTFVMSIIIAGFIFGSSGKLADGARLFTTRIAGDRGGSFVDLAGATIRNVSRGVIGISLLQTILAGIGLIMADIQAAGLIAFGVLVLGIIQVGPSILLIPVIIWCWTWMDTGPAILFSVYMLAVALMDNVLKPIVMSKGLQTPMLVIFIGVIGGTFTQGLIGLFVGPIVLALAYELLMAWVASDAADRSAQPAKDA